MKTTARKRKASEWPVTAIIFAALLLFIVVATTWWTYSLVKVRPSDVNADVLITYLVLASTFGLLMGLGLLAIAFSALNLSDRSQPLGLPDGSVRALIALLLIALFTVMAVFLL
jgi:hypothetical protein